MITKLGVKYLYGKMVSSAKQKAGMTVDHGQSCQFIQMAQSKLNAEANKKDSTSEELQLFNKINFSLYFPQEVLCLLLIFKNYLHT
jgi:hypothetical protein